MKAACKHTPCPTGYVQWHEWAARKQETHTQQRCPVCGLWAIWKRKQPSGSAPGAAQEESHG